MTGPSGCGKSTLLNMIGALESWDQGEIRVFGQPVPRPDSRKATLFRRNIINYLFQVVCFGHGSNSGTKSYAGHAFCTDSCKREGSGDEPYFGSGSFAEA